MVNSIEVMTAALNEIYEHPVHGRMRLGNWTPEDASRFILPRLKAEQREVEALGAEVAKVIAGAAISMCRWLTSSDLSAPAGPGRPRRGRVT